MKKYWELAELENEVFFEAAILNLFFCYISVKKAAHLYGVSFCSALWMVFPESWKRSSPNFYAHNCIWRTFSGQDYNRNAEPFTKIWINVNVRLVFFLPFEPSDLYLVMTRHIFHRFCWIGILWEHPCIT